MTLTKISSFLSDKKCTTRWTCPAREAPLQLTIGTMIASLLLESSSSPIWRWLLFWSSSIKRPRHCQQCNLEVVNVMVLLWVGKLMLPFDILGVLVVLSFQNYCEIDRNQNLSFKYSFCSGYAKSLFQIFQMFRVCIISLPNIWNVQGMQGGKLELFRGFKEEGKKILRWESL